jgi:speckle-type POZ protein
MVATGVGGDVTFVVGKGDIRCPQERARVRSPVFMAEFFGGMMDARAFKAMLHFIYTDSLPEI